MGGASSGVPPRRQHYEQSREAPGSRSERHYAGKLDGGRSKRTGKDLMETGLRIEITEKPGAALFVYRKVQ